MKTLHLKKLGEFVFRRMEEMGLKDRDIQRKSKKEVSAGTVNRVRRSLNNDIELGSLHGIAVGIEVSIEYLVALALGLDPQDRNILSVEEQDLIYYFRCLPFETQAFILQNVKALCAQESAAIEGMPSPLVLSTPLSPTHKRKGVK